MRKILLYRPVGHLAISSIFIVLAAAAVVVVAVVVAAVVAVLVVLVMVSLGMNFCLQIQLTPTLMDFKGPTKLFVINNICYSQYRELKEFL